MGRQIGGHSLWAEFSCAGRDHHAELRRTTEKKHDTDEHPGGSGGEPCASEQPRPARINKGYTSAPPDPIPYGSQKRRADDVQGPLDRQHRARKGGCSHGDAEKIDRDTSPLFDDQAEGGHDHPESDKPQGKPAYQNAGVCLSGPAGRDDRFDAGAMPLRQETQGEAEQREHAERKERGSEPERIVAESAQQGSHQKTGQGEPPVEPHTAAQMRSGRGSDNGHHAGLADKRQADPPENPCRQQQRKGPKISVGGRDQRCQQKGSGEQRCWGNPSKGAFGQMIGDQAHPSVG